MVACVCLVFLGTAGYKVSYDHMGLLKTTAFPPHSSVPRHLQLGHPGCVPVPCSPRPPTARWASASAQPVSPHLLTQHISAQTSLPQEGLPEGPASPPPSSALPPLIPLVYGAHRGTEPRAGSRDYLTHNHLSCLHPLNSMKNTNSTFAPHYSPST